MMMYGTSDLTEQIYELYYSCGYSVRQIANELNISYEFVEDVLGDGVD